MAVNKLKEMINFLKQVGHIKDAGVHEKMLSACLVDLETGPAIQFHEATDMLQIVQEAEIEGWMREKIQNLVQTKMISSVAREDTKRARAVQQRNLWVYNYLLATEWDVLRSSSHSLDSKLQVVSRRFACLGLTSPSEPTYKLGVAILLLSSHCGPVEDFTLDVGKAFGVLHDLKACVKLASRRSKHSGIPSLPKGSKGIIQRNVQGSLQFPWVSSLSY